MASRDAVSPTDPDALSTKYGFSAAVRSDDLLFVSGQVGSRSDGTPEPDCETQVRKAFANLEAALRAGGCGFDDVIDVTTFSTDYAKHRAVISAVRGEVFTDAPYPTLTALGVTWLAGFDFEIKVIARIPSRASTPVTRRNPPTMWDMASFGFSHISVAEPGRLAFLSGRIATTLGGDEVPEDVAGQAQLAAANLAAALADLGASAHDIVLMRVYVVNATTEAFRQAVAPLHAMLGDAMPSMTTIGVQALFRPEIKVEIEMVVRLP